MLTFSLSLMAQTFEKTESGLVLKSDDCSKLDHAVSSIKDWSGKLKNSECHIDQPGVFIPLPRLALHGKLLPIWGTGFWNWGPVA